MAKQSIFQRVTGYVRKLLGLETYKIYRYVVRASGIVVPPVKRKKNAKQRKEKTHIQWELSFEEAPYFRTFTAREDSPSPQKRYENFITETVRAQEVEAMRRKVFTWFVERDAEEVSTGELQRYLNNPQRGEDKKLEEKSQINEYQRPHFEIQAIDFEPFDSFTVPADQIKKGMSDDGFRLKLYRPNEDESYQDWRGTAEHQL
jgi:G3E family GTPase